MHRTPSALPVRAAAWAAFVVLAGLLAMHGLGTHGTAAADEPMATMSHAAHEVVDGDPVAAVLSAPSPEHGALHGTATCVAVLTLLAGTALLLLLAARSPRRAWRVAGHAERRRGPRRTRAPDPPDLMRWSILRC